MLSQVDPVAWTQVNPEFADTTADGFDVTQVACSQPLQSNPDLRLGAFVTQSV